MSINVEIKTHYGTEHIYVVSPEAKKHISWLTRKLTLNRGDVDALRGLGVEVNLVNSVTI